MPNILALRRIIKLIFNLTKLFRVMRHEAGMTIWVQLLGDHTPKIWEGKKCPNFGTILDNL